MHVFFKLQQHKKSCKSRLPVILFWKWTGLLNSITHCSYYSVLLTASVLNRLFIHFRTEPVKSPWAMTHYTNHEGNDSCPLYLSVCSSLPGSQFYIWSVMSDVAVGGRGFCPPSTFPRLSVHQRLKVHKKKWHTCPFWFKTTSRSCEHSRCFKSQCGHLCLDMLFREAVLWSAQLSWFMVFLWTS